MDNLVFDGRGDCLLGCHSSRGGGNWISPTRPERLRRRLTAGVDKKKTKLNQTKQTSKQPQQKAGKKDKEHMVEIK